MKIGLIKQSIDQIISEVGASGPLVECVVRRFDAQGLMVEEKAIAEIVFDRGDEQLAPHDPYINHIQQMIIKIQ